MSTKDIKYHIVHFGKRLVLFLAGLYIIQIGVSLFFVLNIGSDPFSVFTQGLANITGITVGNMNRILTSVLLVILLIFDRSNINIGTILAMIFAGSMIDFNLLWMNNIIPSNLNIIMKVFLFFAGLIPVSIGFPMLKSSNLGVAPNDCIYFLVVDKLNKPYGIARIVTDFVYLMAGYLLGGVVGIGTVISVFCNGPCVQWVMSSSIYNKVSKSNYANT